jgi:hypothetical protein
LTTNAVPAESIQLSETTCNFIRQLFLTSPVKAKCLVQVALKYGPENGQNILLRLHLNAIQKLVDDLENTRLRRKSLILVTVPANADLAQQNADSQPDKIKRTLFTLINALSIYQLELKVEKKSGEDVVRNNGECSDMLAICFRTVCFKFNKIWSENLDEMDENFRQVYASLLFEYNEADELTSAVKKNDKNNNKDTSKLNMLNFFSRVHYEVDREISMTSTFNDDSLPILSLIKQYANVPNKEIYLWRRFFLFCYVENKILLRSIIDECLTLIGRNQYDQLGLVFSIKEFLNLKPLVLLLGMSKSQDIHNAKKLIASLCVNSDKGTLINKLGNLLKTHLDFMTWFQQIKP